jgi:hypothetical protein
LPYSLSERARRDSNVFASVHIALNRLMNPARAIAVSRAMAEEALNRFAMTGFDNA